MHIIRMHISASMSYYVIIIILDYWPYSLWTRFENHLLLDRAIYFNLNIEYIIIILILIASMALQWLIFNVPTNVIRWHTLLPLVLQLRYAWADKNVCYTVIRWTDFTSYLSYNILLQLQTSRIVCEYMKRVRLSFM